MKSTLLLVYSRLLTDLANTFKEPLLEAHWDISEEWVLKTAPLLDKAILRITEDLQSLGNIMAPSPDYYCNLDADMITERTLRLYITDEMVKPNPTAMLEWLEATILLIAKKVGGFIIPEEELTARLSCAHQSLVFCYKAEYEPTKDQLEEAFSSFLNTDDDIKTWDEYFSTRHQSPIYRCARSLVSQVIYKANWEEIAPHHGPGAVWPSCNPEDKSKFDTYYEGIDRVYPYSEWMCGLYKNWLHYYASLQSKDKSDIVCRIQAVPKDSRGPRLICVHPKEAIWIQQGCRHVLEREISTSHLTAGKINFTDQSVNANLALRSSKDGAYATIDLKDASDRLSNKLVQYLFGDFVFSKLSCSRASKVQIGTRVYELRKFAPMGNALTFPVQSLVFWAVVRAGIYTKSGINCDDVYVFGDDIIVPTKHYEAAIVALVRFGLVPNPSKCFYAGSFRESCGVDAWNGTDITPLRMRFKDIITMSDMVSATDLAKKASIRGYHRVSAYLYQLVERRFGRLSLTNNRETAGLVRYEDCKLDRLFLYEKSLRFNRKLHRWEVPSYLLTRSNSSPRTHDWYHVQDSLLRLSRLGDRQSERGLRYPDLRRERLERRWTPVIER